MNIKKRDILLIIIFLILQIVWFNHILFLGRFQPLIYIFPLLILQLKNTSENIILAFIMGITIDFFLHTGGVFAATSVLVVYLRNIYFSFIIKQYQEKDNFMIQKIDFSTRLIYYLVFIFVAYIFIYLFESFSISLTFNKLGFLLINTLITLLIFIFIDVFIISTDNN